MFESEGSGLTTSNESFVQPGSQADKVPAPGFAVQDRQASVGSRPKPQSEKASGKPAKVHVVPSLDPLEKWTTIYGLDEARKGVWEKPTQVIGNLLLAQSATLVSAHPHSMKSLAWLQASIEAPARKTVWGYFPAPNVTKTLFIETEDPPWLVQERIRGLAIGLGIGEDERIPGFRWMTPGPFDIVKDRQNLANVLARVRPDFVVISTLQNIIPGRDLNEQKDMAPVNKVVLELARRFCPIVMITHSTWDKQNRRALGTITQTANYATTLHFAKSGDEVSVKLDSKIGSDEEEFSLELLTQRVSYKDEAGAEKRRVEVRRLAYKPKRASKREQVEAVIQELGDSASSEEIASRAGVSDRYVRQIRKGSKIRTKRKKAARAATDEKNISSERSEEDRQGLSD